MYVYPCEKTAAMMQAKTEDARTPSRACCTKEIEEMSREYTPYRTGNNVEKS